VIRGQKKTGQTGGGGSTPNTWVSSTNVGATQTERVVGVEHIVDQLPGGKRRETKKGNESKETHKGGNRRQ